MTIQSILDTDTATRCPDIRFIWSHGGGTAPHHHAAGWARPSRPRWKAERQPGRDAEVLLRHRAGVQRAHASDVHQVVPMATCLFGTDYPFAQAGTVAKGPRRLPLHAGGPARAIERRTTRLTGIVPAVERKVRLGGPDCGSGFQPTVDKMEGLLCCVTGIHRCTAIRIDRRGHARDGADDQRRHLWDYQRRAGRRASRA